MAPASVPVVAGLTGGPHVAPGGELELLQRSMGFAALGLVTLVPLLIVVAAALPFHGNGFAQWVVDGMGLSARPAEAVRELFAAPRKVISSTSGLSLLALALFGLSFAACVEVGYTRIWQVPPTPWHHVWRRAVWLAALTAYLFAEAQSGVVLGGGGRTRCSAAARPSCWASSSSGGASTSCWPGRCRWQRWRQGPSRRWSASSGCGSSPPSCSPR